MNGIGQAKLYYLYMMSDGDVSANEKKIFKKICKDLYVDADDKTRIIKECEEICKEEGLSCIDVLKKNTEEDFIYGILDIDLDKYVSDYDKASIMWNLINLGYADTRCSSDEKEVVDFLCEYWEIQDSLYQEMLDVAETVLALEAHKRWVKDTLPECETKQAKLKQIKKDIKFVRETIKTTISEKNQ